MTNILAIEASTDACSVALLVDKELSGDYCEERYLVQAREHSKILLPMVSELLTSNKLTMNLLDVIAFSAGPGSFTGLRIAAGLTQGLAFSNSLPVIAISSLEIFAQTALNKIPMKDAEIILVAQDARMNELYFGAYRVKGDSVEVLISDKIIKNDALMGECQPFFEGAVILVGSGWALLNVENIFFTNRDGSRQALIQNDLLKDLYPRASAMIPLVKKAYGQGKAVTASKAIPVYLRDSISWKKWQKKQVIR